MPDLSPGRRAFEPEYGGASRLQRAMLGSLTTAGITQRPRIVAWAHPDPWLLGIAGILALVGLVMVFDAGFFIGQERYGDAYALVRRQASVLLVGILGGFLLIRIPAQALRKLAYPALGGVLFLLVLVLIPGLGEVRNGARRWLAIGGFSFEPSELLKPAFILYLAHSLARKQARITSFSYGVLPHMIMAGVPILLLLAQPDFGGSVLIALLTGVLLFVAGARPAHLGALALLGATAGFALIRSSPYRWERFIGFLSPWEHARDEGFQLVQSFLAFGHGGFGGVGLGNGRQKLFYLPEGHTDFIFALIGEELGFLGGLAVLILFALVALRGFRVATRATDPFTSLAAFGLTFCLVGQAAMNVGVVLGLLPTKGLPLPLLSYGGSSLLVTVGMVSLLLGLSREVR